jgi:hypothetical protein
MSQEKRKGSGAVCLVIFVENIAQRSLKPMVKKWDFLKTNP